MKYIPTVAFLLIAFAATSSLAQSIPPEGLFDFPDLEVQDIPTIDLDPAEILGYELPDLTILDRLPERNAFLCQDTCDSNYDVCFDGCTGGGNTFDCTSQCFDVFFDCQRDCFFDDFPYDDLNF